MQNKFNTGFTLIELLVIIAILGFLSTIIIGTFIDFRKSHALEKDTELIVEVLRQARNQTISSKNASLYGVHFGTSAITLFTGSAYNASSPSNQVYPLNGTDSIVTISLLGGGNSIVFQRLSGETSQSGTITISSPSTGKTKVVTIYKTGVVES